MLTDNAMSETMSPLLLAQTAKSALMGAASGSITTLTEGALHAMFLNKIKLVSSIILMVAGIGSAGVGVYYLHAQAPPKGWEQPGDYDKLLQDLEKPLRRPDVVAPDKKAAVKPEEYFRKLLEARRDMAEEEWRIRSGLYRAGANEPGTGNPVTLHLVIDASKRLLRAELELSTNRADRLKAREKYFNHVKEYADVTEKQHKVGRVIKAALASALYEQLDAEIELEREKAVK
jgi:hypothetical protein